MSFAQTLFLLCDDHAGSIFNSTFTLENFMNPKPKRNEVFFQKDESPRPLGKKNFV
jgi:hypothetical protein